MNIEFRASCRNLFVLQIREHRTCSGSGVDHVTVAAVLPDVGNNALFTAGSARQWSLGVRQGILKRMGHGCSLSQLPLRDPLHQHSPIRNHTKSTSRLLTMDLFSQFDSLFFNLDSTESSPTYTPDSSSAAVSTAQLESFDPPVDQDRAGGGQILGLCVIS